MPYDTLDPADRGPADRRLRRSPPVRAPAPGPLRQARRGRGAPGGGGHRLGRGDDRRRRRAQRAAPFGEHGHGVTFWHWIPAGKFSGRRRLLRRRPDRLPADRGDHDRPARPHLLDRLHEPRPGLLAVLRLPQPVHVLDALLVLADSFLVVFVAWELVGLSSYLLIGFWFRAPERGPGQQEGVHRQPRRRRRVRPRDHADLRQLGTLEHPGGRWPRIGKLDHDHDQLSSPCSCFAARSARAPSSRSTSGCPTRWRARPRSRP